MHHEYRSMKNRLLKSPLTAAAAVALLAGAAFLPGCGKAQKEKIKADVKAEVLAELGGAAPQGPVESSSSCVSCHTDEERLKMETAGIKQPKGSALTSGKG